VRHGVVAEFEPPTRVTFHQPMTANPRVFGVIDIRVTYTVTEQADHVHVSRAVRLELPWQLKLVRPFVVYQIGAESERTMLALKTYTDGRG
jgi:hypothetical protein